MGLIPFMLGLKEVPDYAKNQPALAGKILMSLYASERTNYIGNHGIPHTA